MSEIQFSKNYNDLSEQHGVKAGFQFEFYCERCSETWRAEFVPFRTGQASGWLGKAAGAFGGVLGRAASDAVGGLAESGWGEAHDQAFPHAIGQAKNHFHRCAKCHQYVCGVCWNGDKGLCLECAPSAEVEIQSARARGEADGAGEKAALEGVRRGTQMDVKVEKQLVCPECGAETKGAKFCPECGHKLAISDTCPACSAKVSPTVKFCPECGEKLR